MNDDSSGVKHNLKRTHCSSPLITTHGHFHLVHTICKKALAKPLHLEWWEACKLELNLSDVFTVTN